jgi:uncharacterized membrane protein affecting hemolysin expression
MNTKFFLLLAALLLASNTISSSLSRRQSSPIDLTNHGQVHISAASENDDVMGFAQINNVLDDGNFSNSSHNDDDAKFHHFHFERFRRIRKSRSIVFFVLKLLLLFIHVCSLFFCNAQFLH